MSCRLANCELSDESCGIVAGVLQSPNHLKELDLSHNDLGNTGVQLLSAGLSSPQCRMQTLRLVVVLLVLEFTELFHKDDKCVTVLEWES